jgi:hypothetical protein
MMTPSPSFSGLDTPAFAALGGPDLVYVREVSATELMQSLPEEVVRGFDLEPDQTLYAVHRANGERLAVLSNRESAFAAALTHELVPVSVH